MKKNEFKVLVCFGTRPEAIKLAPLIKRLQNEQIETIIVITAQHREMLDQVLGIFGIKADYDLNIMVDDQSLFHVASSALTGLEKILKRENPNLIIVQGDSTSTFIGSLAGFYTKIPVAHVEAGLRTYNKQYPFPEEISRRLTSELSCLHFAPTKDARTNLLKMGINKKDIFVTGNTVIDALLMIAARKRKKNRFPDNILHQIDSKKKRLILITAHRRENWGRPIRNICYALKELVFLHPDISIVYPVHLNPNIQKPVYEILKNISRIFLIPPLDYEQFGEYMIESYLILTDSGGIQEEAPALGKPVLVLRKVTERPEAVKAGTTKVIGTEKNHIISEVNKLLNNEKKYKKMAQVTSPYGDGRAAERIAKTILYYFRLRKKRPPEFKYR